MNYEPEKLYEFLRQERSYIPEFGDLTPREKLKLVDILSKLHKFCGDVYYERKNHAS